MIRSLHRDPLNSKGEAFKSNIDKRSSHFRIGSRIAEAEDSVPSDGMSHISSGLCASLDSNVVGLVSGRPEPRHRDSAGFDMAGVMPVSAYPAYSRVGRFTRSTGYRLNTPGLNLSKQCVAIRSSIRGPHRGVLRCQHMRVNSVASPVKSGGDGFMAPEKNSKKFIPLIEVPGIGKATEAALSQAKIASVAQLQKVQRACGLIQVSRSFPRSA